MPATTRMAPTTAAPTPMPAFAPVLRPLLGGGSLEVDGVVVEEEDEEEGDGDVVADAVADAVVVAGPDVAAAALVADELVSVLNSYVEKDVPAWYLAGPRSKRPPLDPSQHSVLLKCL
jgi:hypothetical protein